MLISREKKKEKGSFDGKKPQRGPCPEHPYHRGHEEGGREGAQVAGKNKDLSSGILGLIGGE